MDTAIDRSSPPSRQLLWLELRGIWELHAFFAAYPLLRRAPRGDGHPVLVLPGLAVGTAALLRTSAEPSSNTPAIFRASKPWQWGCRCVRSALRRKLERSR